MSFPEIVALLSALAVGLTVGIFLRRVETVLRQITAEQRETNRLLAAQLHATFTVAGVQDDHLEGVVRHARSWT